MTVPLYNLTDTWNNGATAFTAIQMNVTNTASAAGSLLLDLQVGSTSQFKISKDAILTLGSTSNAAHFYAVPFGSGLGTAAAPIFGFAGGPGIYFPNAGGNFGLALTRSGSVAEFFIDVTNRICLNQNVQFGWNGNNDAAANAPNDLSLYRDAAGILAQRNGINGQTLRIYNSYTDGSNFERGIFDWQGTSNVLTIGTQAAGTGTARSMRFLSAGGGYTFVSPGSSVTPANNGDLMIEATNNTTLTFKYKGSDATVRSVALTLA